MQSCRVEFILSCRVVSKLSCRIFRVVLKLSCHVFCFSDPVSVSLDISHFRYRGAPGRRVGPALDTATKLFATAPNKAGKKITIVVLTGRPQDNPRGPAVGLKKLGVTIYSVGIVPFVKPADLRPIPGPNFVSKWKNLPNVLTKIRIPISRGEFVYIFMIIRKQ